MLSAFRGSYELNGGTRGFSLERFDLVVAGAGTAGSTAAAKAAKAGLKVCLVDAKAEEDIGRKICGDAIGKHHFDNLGMGTPGPDELERVMQGVKIYSPDEKTAYVVRGERMYGYILNRHRFGQRLLKDAIGAGVLLYDRTQVLGPLIEDGFVCGVSARSSDTGERRTLRSSVVIESTGFFATLRRKLNPDFGIDIEVDKRDVEACYREIRQLKQPLDESTLCRIYLTQAKTPGGYYWVFPEGGSKVNVGLGVAMTGKFPNPKDQLYRYVLSQPEFDGSSIVDKGAWYVPTRRPLNSMVANGIIVVGDAACQANPIHGGGIGPSMIGGTLATSNAIKAMEKNDVSREGLWGYNPDYMRDYGAKQAGLEIFRILLQNMDDDDLNYGMHYRLLTEEDVLKASMGEDTTFTINEKVRIAFRGAKKPGLLRKLRNSAKSMRKIKAWYKKYPASPREFEKWKAGAEELFRKAIVKLKN